MNNILAPDELFGIAHDIPYVYQIGARSSDVTLYGCAHLGPENTHEAAEIDTSLSIFRPSLIVVESVDELYHQTPLIQRQAFLRGVSFASLDEALRFGEIGVALRYAIRTGARIVSAEPLIAQQKKILLRDGIPAVRVEAFFILRTYASLRSHKGYNFQSAMQMACAKIPPATIYAGLSPDEFVTEIQQNFPSLAFDSVDFIGAFDPTVASDQPEHQWTNDIARKLTIKRDQTVCCFIISKVELESRIFVLYGASHVVAWENALLSRIPDARKYGQRGEKRASNSSPRV